MEEIFLLEIPAKPAFVGVARSAVTAVATTVPEIDDDRLEDLRIAVSEACTNAVEAHLTVPTDDKVILRCLLDDARLEVHIQDVGQGFDPAAIPPRAPFTEPSQLTAERGWGLQLIRALVDEVDFVDHGQGTSVHLVIRRAPGV
jgi:serine/threonine-protein kinase RsbW